MTLGPMVLRCSGDATIGLGHLFRCLGLADELAQRGLAVTFAINPGAVAAVPQLGGYDSVEMTGDEDTQVAALHRRFPGGVAALVVDTYLLDHRFMTACRGWADTVVVLDDPAERRLDGDILVNPNLGAENLAYDGLLPATCRRLLGPCYALLRPQFAALRDSALARRSQDRPVDRVLVAFGGTDPANATALALDALGRACPGIEIDVLLGSVAPHLDTLRRRHGHRLRLHLDVADVAPLLADADLAIGAGGNSALERCVLGLPTVLVTIADNQLGLARALEAAGAARLVGDIATLDAAALAGEITGLARDARGRAAMSRAAAELCDGRGASRVVDHILDADRDATRVAAGGT